MQKGKELGALMTLLSLESYWLRVGMLIGGAATKIGQSYHKI